MTDAEEPRTTPEQEGALDATVNEKVDGLVEQIRADIASGDAEDAASILSQRLGDSGIQVTEEEFRALLTRIGA
ncbi:MULTISPECIES: hypothetical protein [unclassified Cryobacterium]|uniref:hypothetical protein n=1 Tax=unclassified Cryobacterium TaxID=2649013 RepID=UPI0014460973|nr:MULTISPECIES: hypothetical protein [unclassified Cryobacterium]